MTEHSKYDSRSDTNSTAHAAKKEDNDPMEERRQLADRMSKIKRKIIVMSGKGGVGKSTTAVNLAFALAKKGLSVGLLDVDIHGPSIPALLGLEDQKIAGNGKVLFPVDAQGLKVMSIGFMLQNRNDAIIWRGPMKHGLIKQFLKDVEWGSLDYLIVDSPPGTGDEPLTVCQLINDPYGALIVTTPQKLALLDVRKSITFCRQLNMPVLGVVENMSGLVCPKCGTVVEVFKTEGARAMADEMGVPFLGAVPLDPDIVSACDNGVPYLSTYTNSRSAQAFETMIRSVIEPDAQPPNTMRENTMRIAIPTVDGKLSMHFGHCEQFAIVEANIAAKKIGNIEFTTPPPHEPGALPKWLAEQQADIIIASGMGTRAQGLFEAQNIKVVVGAPCLDPISIVQSYMDGTLENGANVCDH